MHIELVKTYDFEAAHSTPWNGGEERLHGHSFRVEIVVAGDCDPRLGWLIDYAEIPLDVRVINSTRLKALFSHLQQLALNEIARTVSPPVDPIYF